MTTPPSFPVLAGQGWSVHKRPTFSTRVASHLSGREARTPFYAYPLYEFEVLFEALASNSAWPGLGANSLQSLMGLYLQCRGQAGSFLYTDPSDHSATAQPLAIGDATTLAFVFQRSLGSFLEPVSFVTGVGAVYLDGAALASGWSLTAPNTLTFASAPASGTVVSADFTFAYECRFLDDQVDFENFMSGLWTVQGLKFRSVKA